MLKRRQQALIIGAGATGLSAAHQLLKLTDVRPIVLEREAFVGGRNFFADEQTLALWQEIFPDVTAPAAAVKIFCRGKFFDCPVTASWATFNRFEFFDALSMGASFLRTKIFPRDELTTADRVINRVGQKFFDTVLSDSGATEFGDEKIFCPVDGTRQVWENFAAEIKKRGGEVLTNADVKNLRIVDGVVKSAQVESLAGTLTFPADYFLAPTPRDGTIVEVVAEKIFVDAPCRIYVNDPSVKVARVEIFGTHVKAVYLTDDDDFATLAAAELVALGIIAAADIKSIAVEKISAPVAVPDDVKNFFATHTAAQSIADREATR